MEQIQKNTILDSFYAEFYKLGYASTNYAFYELETLLYIAKLNKDQNLLVDFSKEGSLARYLQNNDENIVEAEELLANVRIYNDRIQEFYKEFVKLSDEELLDLFEYAWEKTSERKAAYGFEFDTTKEIADLVFGLYPNSKGRVFIDICSGNGYMLSRAAENGFDEFKGYEFNSNAAAFSRMRGFMHGRQFEIAVGDVLQNPLQKEGDLVFTQPPFSLRTYKPTSPDDDRTFIYKDSEKTAKADWHFIFKALNSTKKNGKTFVLVLDGALFNTPDAFYRKQVIENKRLETVINLPQGILNGTNVASNLLVFSDGNKEINFIDASDCFVSENAYKRRLDTNAVLGLVFANAKSDKVVTVDLPEIDNKNYALNVSRYIGGDITKKVKYPAILKDHAKIIPGFQYTTRSIEEKKPGEGNVSVVKITNINNGSIDYDNLASIDIDEKKVDNYLLKDNDILVSTKGTAIKLALVEGLGDRKLVSHSNMMTIRCNEDLDPIYLICFLGSNLGSQILRSTQTGSIIMNITRGALENITFSLADADTQAVIASRYRILNREIAKKEEDLAAAKAKLATLWEDEVE